MDWQLFTRNQFAEATGGIPAINAKATIRRIATGVFIVEAPYTPAYWRRLAPGCGLIIRRGGHTILSGVWTRCSWRRPTTEQPIGTIALEGVSDDVIGQYRLALPDPTRPLDQQTTVPNWIRGPAPIETLMHQLVNDNCGPGALAPSPTWPDTHDRRISGLVMGVDQGRGPVVTWTTLRYPTVQGELQRMAAFAEASGVRLLPKFHQTGAGLTFEVLDADDRTGQVVFGPGLGNLDDQEYLVEAGTVGVAVSGGQGNLEMRKQKMAITTDELTQAFGFLAEVYVDRRDTADWDELLKASREAVDGGSAKVTVRCTALDTPGTRYGADFDLNTLATVKIGPPGIDPDTGEQYAPIAVFDDLVRELSFAYDPTNTDRPDQVIAAVGSEGASTGVVLPSLARIAALNAQVAQLQRSL